MRRPVGVSLIAAVSFLNALYLLVAGITMLVRPGGLLTIATRRQAHFFELVGAYPVLGAGAMWALIGGGLLTLRNWARWATMLFAGFRASIVLAKMLTFGVRLHWSSVWAGLQIAIEVAVVWYLFRQSTADYFRKTASAPQ